MPTQHALNPNNRQSQATYNTKPSNVQTFSLNIVGFNDVHLCSRREFHNPPTLTISENFEHSKKINESRKQEEENVKKQYPKMLTLPITLFTQRLETKQLIKIQILF